MSDGRKSRYSLFYLEAGMLWLSGRNEKAFFPATYRVADERILVFGEQDKAEKDFFLLCPIRIAGNQDRPGRKFSACFGQE